MSQWLGLENPPEVMPIGDTREHVEGRNCWCEPTDIDGVLVHNSADGREHFETGKRKPS